MTVPKIDLPQFLVWLATQDPESTYRYTDNFDCLFARCLKDHGVEYPMVGVGDYDIVELPMLGSKTIETNIVIDPEICDIIDHNSFLGDRVRVGDVQEYVRQNVLAKEEVE